jgi:hypothetical protein
VEATLFFAADPIPALRHIYTSISEAVVLQEEREREREETSTTHERLHVNNPQFNTTMSTTSTFLFL